MKQTSILHSDQFGSRTNNNLQDILHTKCLFIDKSNYRYTEEVLHSVDSKAEYDRMIFPILIIYLFLIGVH